MFKSNQRNYQLLEVNRRNDYEDSKSKLSTLQTYFYKPYIDKGKRTQQLTMKDEPVFLALSKPYAVLTSGGVGAIFIKSIQLVGLKKEVSLQSVSDLLLLCKLLRLDWIQIV